MTNSKRYYISTAIPYVNARPHIGHALEFVLTDALARYHRLKGEEGISTPALVKRNAVHFHAIYWPAMLLSAGAPLPTTLFIHGYITLEGQKVSKSLGNTVDPAGTVIQPGGVLFPKIEVLATSIEITS